MRIIALTILCLLAALPLAAQEETLKQRADKLVERIEQRPDKVWDYAFALRNMAQGDNRDTMVAYFEATLEHKSDHVRMAAAQLTLAMGRAELAYEVLGALLESEHSAVVEGAAAMITREMPDDDELVERIRDRWETSDKLATGARVALSEALLTLEGDDLALEQLREFLTSSDHELMGRAALVLSERGHAREVAQRLASLAREPGDIGRLARISGEVNKIDIAIEDHKSGKVKRKDKLIEVEIRAIRKHYADDFFVYNEKQQELSGENLVDNACRGMALATDRYGSYMTRAEIDEMNQDQEGRYVGIGAHVSQGEDGLINIDQPIYEGPAYAVGVRTGDKLVGILGPDGTRIDLTKVKLDEGVRYVRGPEGSTAVIFVKRRGVEGELKFEIPRRMVKVDTALEEMLPGDVGYVRLTRFGANSDVDMKESLESLRRRGMKYLILDLRGNGGGQLSTVVAIADMLLPKGKVISSTGGRWGDWKGKQRPFTSEGGDFTEIPLVCLIDGESASGSEMLSGALKDNNRAVLIGRPSFGKGIGQSFFSVDESGNTRILKCTVFSYYLPSGVSIDRYEGEGGVTPHILTKPDLLEPWQVYAIDKLRKSKRLVDYLDEHYRGEKKASMMRLASFDALDVTAWPEFDKFYGSLNTRLAKDDVRRELRFALRTRVQDDRGAEFTQNYQEDPTLLRGVDELLKKAGKDARQIAEYKAVMK
ncbi:MAG: hypothetical protein IPK87_11410 [Planctomycetes bacterium]|nr:hypothetical protein [Planctomycetota bacterium]